MSDFVEHVKEMLASFGPIQARRMFGGYGLYRDDVMFGLVSDDTLYLKVDKDSVGHFVERGLTPFHYSRKDEKAVTKSYYLAPEEILEDREQAAMWARRSYEAASRTKPKKKRRQRDDKYGASSR